MANAGKKEARRQARLERKAQEADRRRRARRNRSLTLLAVAVVAAAGIGWLVWNSLRPAAVSGPAQPGVPSGPQVIKVADQGRAHVRPGEPHPTYNSNPPTSGWHFAATAPWGFHNTDLPDELIIHNLEHGGIWITYKDAADEAVVDALVALAREYRTKVIVTHRPANDSRIAVAAWGRLMELDEFDRRAITDFIDRFKNKGPEFVPD